MKSYIIYVLFYENGAKEYNWNSRAKREFFLSPKAISNRLPSFHIQSFPIFCPFTWLGGSLKE